MAFVSDSGTQFPLYKFQQFVQVNGIKHKTCALLKPPSNGQAEINVHIKTVSKTNAKSPRVD